MSPSLHTPTMLRLTGSLLLLFMFLSTGCGSTGYEDEDPPPPPPPAEELDPTFTNVHQIMQRSCGGSQCHLSGSESGVSLSSYEDVMNSVGDQYGTEIVDPGNSGGSPIVDKIQPNPTHGDRMPLDATPLDDDEIQLIIDWIDADAPNN